MPEPLPFCKIKLQYLSEMATDPQLGDQAFRIISYLALVHADHETGAARPTFKTIAKATGRDPKSVKRALRKAEAAGYLEIERGTNIGNSSRYRPTKAALKRAAERRKEQDKIVPLSRSRGGQNCPVRGTDMSGKGGQKRPPNLDQELKEKTREPDFVFVPTSSKAAQEWQDLCDRHIGTRLVHLVGEVGPIGKRGFLLPSFWPPADRSEWPEMARHLSELGKSQVAEASNA
jgi:DNA-binding MarR family transcriptional regulator